MRDELDQIDWESLGHAYGSASDVPELLRALWDPDAADNAYDELFGNIWHQGTVYEATSYAVPFIVEVASSASAPKRAKAMSLLRCIAEGSSYLDVHRPFFAKHQPESEADTAHLDEQQATELDWVRRAVEAVAHERASLVDILRNDPSDKMRSGAACVLGTLHPYADELLPTLRALLNETLPPLATAGACAAIAELCVWASADSRSGLTDQLAALATHDDAAVVRALATVAFVLVAPELPLPTEPSQFASGWPEAEQVWREGLFTGTKAWSDPVRLLGDRPHRLWATAALLRHDDRDVVLRSTYAALGLHRERRDVGDQLTPPLVDLVRSSDQQIQARASSLLAEWGSAASAATEELLGIVASPPPRGVAPPLEEAPYGLGEGPERTFELALVTLVRLQERRALPALQRVLDHGPPDAAARFLSELDELTSDLMPSIVRLADGYEHLGEPWAIRPPGVGYRSLVREAKTITALAGEPTIQQALAQDGYWFALAMASQLDASVVPFIEAEIDRADGDPYAGVAWIHAGGDPARVLELAERSMDGPGGHALLAELGPVGRRLSERLEAQLDTAVPTSLDAAKALWRTTGDAQRAVQPLIDIAASPNAAVPGPGNPALEALAVLGEMGEAAAEALPRLRALVASNSRIQPQIQHRVIWSDEEFVAAAKTTIAHIEA